MEEEQALLEKKNMEDEVNYKVKKRVMDLLPDADNNIAKLQVTTATLTICSGLDIGHVTCHIHGMFFFNMRHILIKYCWACYF